MAKKICPYNHAREVQHYEQSETFGDYSEQRIGYTYDMRVDFIPMPCVGEDCGAWDSGRCRYASVNSDNR